MSKQTNLPQHIAIIMDGNGRWARLHNLPRYEGHRAGAENIRRVVEAMVEFKIGYLTLYAFSTENWGRSRLEIRGLLRIFRDMVDSELENLHKQNIRLRHLGLVQRLPGNLRKRVEKAVELTRHNTGMTLAVAFDYGSRTEIADAVRCLMDKGVSSQDIDDLTLRDYFYAPDLPDPDLIIRTGGEMRLSNFYLWQAAYSELYFTDVLWPDFGRTEIDNALATYTGRKRRFGKR